MKKTLYKFYLILSSALIVSTAWIDKSYAAIGGGIGDIFSGGGGAGKGLGPYSSSRLSTLTGFLDPVLKFIFGAAGAIFVIMFIIGGVQYLTSAGNEEASTKAKKLLMDAVIGIVIVVAAWAISDWILKGIGGTANFGQ